MNSKSFCNLGPRRLAIERLAGLIFIPVVLCALLAAPRARAGGDAPAWMHALANVPLPPHDEKTNAVLLYSDRTITVLSVDKMRTVVREAYKILRPSGREHGIVGVPFNSDEKVARLHGWCIPAQGKDYEVKDKEAAEVSLPKIEGSELVSDVRFKLLQIPAADPGNIIGYEYEVESHPLLLQETWRFQGEDPVAEAHYTLQLPPGWEYKAHWLNYPEVKPEQAGNNQWKWVVAGVKELREEEQMPPWRSVAGQMIVSFYPPGGARTKGFASWQEMGNWYLDLTSGRRDASPEIKQKATALMASAPTPLDKMRALAKSVQREIRYVAIELGIGGWQPHAAAEVFTHRYGDCKDKATLMGSMLHEIGVDSYYVLINSQRGSVTPNVPAYAGGFDHAILAIKLPEGVADPSLIAVTQHPKLGRILFFDPTDELTPLGQLSGALQANYGLLVTPDGGELVELPEEPPAMNGIQRTARMTLDPAGTLKGDIKEIREGDQAWSPRRALQRSAKTEDQIKFIEAILSQSFATYQLTHASVTNLKQTERPFECDYSLVAENYAKVAGNLLLVRPRVVGTKTMGILETKEPRRFPVEFEGPARDTDTFEITLPAGYEVDDLPPPVDADYSFASYHSKSEVSGNVLRYTRTFEMKGLSVPLSKVDDLKKFYRVIAGDERSTAVLKPSSH